MTLVEAAHELLDAAKESQNRTNSYAEILNERDRDLETLRGRLAKAMEREQETAKKGAAALSARDKTIGELRGELETARLENVSLMSKLTEYANHPDVRAERAAKLKAEAERLMREASELAAPVHTEQEAKGK